MSQDTFVFGPYWNGVEDVYADPLTVDRELRSMSNGQVWGWLRDLRAEAPKDNEGDPEQVRADNAAKRIGIEEKARKAAAALIPLIRLVFEMVPYDKKKNVGATENDCHRVLTQWFVFVAQKKSNTEPSQT